MRRLFSALGAIGLLMSGSAITAAEPSGNSSAATAPLDAAAKKQFVIDFYNKALNEKDFDAASQYLGDRYIQHNPTAADGAEGLKGFIAFLKTQFPQQRNEIKHAYVDGDIVILHVHSVRTPGTLGRAIVDIFRLENGKVVEHWDVIQDVPDPAAAKNPNGMF